MRRILFWTTCLAILLVLPQAASACGSACLYPNGCATCTYVGGDSGACFQYDTCVCYDVQCGFALPPEQGQIGSLEVFGLGVSEPSECSVPAASIQVWSLVSDTTL